MEALTAIVDDGTIVYRGEARSVEGLKAEFPDVWAFEFKNGASAMEMRGTWDRKAPPQSAYGRLVSMWQAAAPKEPDPETPAERIERLRLRAGSRFSKAIEAGVTWNGNQFQTDRHGREVLAVEVLAAQAGERSDSDSLMMADGSEVVVTNNELLTLFGTVRERMRTAQQVLAQVVRDIESGAVTTEDEVDNAPWP